MDIVEFKHSLSSFVKEGEVIAKLAEKVRALPELHALKFNPELIVYIGSILEHEIEGKKPEERKEMIVKILKIVYPQCNADDVKIFESSIIFLQENKKIKKVSTYKYITKSVSNLFVKKA
jgi:hypothetical protein